MVGAQAVARSAPDGYTLLVIDRAGLTAESVRRDITRFGKLVSLLGIPAQ